VYGVVFFFFFFQAEDGIRDYKVTGVQTCALPIYDQSLGRSLARSVRDVGRHGGRFPWRGGPLTPAPTCRRSPPTGSIRRAPGYYRAVNRRAPPGRLRGGERVSPILPAMPRVRPDSLDASQCDCAEGRPWPIAF